MALSVGLLSEEAYRRTAPDIRGHNGIWCAEHRVGCSLSSTRKVTLASGEPIRKGTLSSSSIPVTQPDAEAGSPDPVAAAGTGAGVHADILVTMCGMAVLWSLHLLHSALALTPKSKHSCGSMKLEG